MDFIGIDGCRAGWFWIGLSAPGRYELGVATATDATGALAEHPLPSRERAGVRGKISRSPTLLQLAQSARLILIDIPIGLRDEGGEERLCDREARRLLGAPRASSVFPAPTRPALYANSYEEACEINARLCGRRLSRQTWGIAQKIRRIDELLRSREDLRAFVRESHPEICFWSLNGQRAMSENKKRKPGRQERLNVLKRFFREAEAVVETATKAYRRKGVASDDIIDALMLAVTAKLGYGRLRTLPAMLERDSFGLPMEIVFAEYERNQSGT